MAYISFYFLIDENSQELEIARLHQLGVDSFIQHSAALEAFIDTDLNRDLESELDQYLNQNSIPFKKETHDSTDWNRQWEENFKPIVIRDRLLVRASFHKNDAEIPEELIISPRMAFGTGHHETTAMILSWMTDQNFLNSDVLDFGCGTGILGIYAAYRNAGSVCLIDYDILSIDNTHENIALNNLSGLEVIHGSFETIPGKQYDFVIANITRNILSEGLQILSAHLKAGAKIILSGFLTEDELFMKEKIEKSGLRFVEKLRQNDWICLIAQNQ